jgi:KDO2-lipid IV(A) lauroyltransferase
MEHVRTLHARGGPAIFFSGHIANWELIGPALAALDISMAGFYRAASNPLTDEIIQGLRRAARGGNVPLFAKGARGAREAVAHLRAGGFLGIMVDQKMNDGIPIPFFGHDAMTAPAIAHFALRFHCPVVPIHVVRLAPARFRLICEAPLSLAVTGDRSADTRAMMLAINEILEAWIRAAPASWLWLHRRWPKENPEAMVGAHAA